MFIHNIMTFNWKLQQIHYMRSPFHNKIIIHKFINFQLIHNTPLQDELDINRFLWFFHPSFYIIAICFLFLNLCFFCFILANVDKLRGIDKDIMLIRNSHLIFKVKWLALFVGYIWTGGAHHFAFFYFNSSNC